MKGLKKLGIVFCSLCFALISIFVYSTQVKADYNTAGDTFVIIDGTYYYAYNHGGESVEVTTSSSSFTYSADYIYIVNYASGGGESFSDAENSYNVSAGGYEIYIEDFYSNGGDDVFSILLTVTSSSSGSSGSGSSSSGSSSSGSTSDTTAPKWYTSNTSSIYSGDAVSVQLTDETKLWGYSSASTYYKYGWSTSSSSFDGTWLTSFSSTTSTNVSFSATAPTVSSSTTYYLWIYYQGKDDAGNVATYSGKTPYYIGSTYSAYVKYQYTVNYKDTQAPVWYTSNVTSVTSGSSVSVQLTDNVYIYSYSSSTYYKYGWSTSSSSSPTWLTTFSSQTSTKVAFSITVPTVTSSTIYYLWIYNQGKDSSDNVSTFSGKTPYYKGTAASSYVKYQYTVTPKTTTDSTAPTIKCGGTTLSTTRTYKNNTCSLVFSDNSNLASYTISGSISASGTISGTSYTYGTLIADDSYTIVVKDAAGNTTTGYLTLDFTVPIMRAGSSTGTALSTGSTNYYSASSKVFYFSDTISGYKKATHDYTGAPSAGVYDVTSTSITLYEGYEYTITVYDNAGNSAKFKIILDTFAPTITCGGTILSAGLVYKNASCELTFSDLYFKSYSISGAESTTGTSSSYTISTEGAYTITAYDYAGNSKTEYITLDFTAPVMRAGSSSGTALTAGGTMNYFAASSKTFYFSDALSGYSKATYDFVTAPSSAIYDTTNTSMTLSTSLEYRIKVYDVAGNSATYYIILDNTAPVWSATNSSSLSNGSSVTVTLTESGENPSGIYNYSRASSYYKYGWSSSSSTVPSSWSTTFTTTSSTKVSFTTTAPTVSSHSYQYLWIYEAGRDNAGNVATYSGKSFYESVTSSTSYIKYQYYVYASDRSSPTITCGGTSLSMSRTYKTANCSLVFSDNSNLSSYTITGAVSASGSISGTSYTYGTLSTEGEYTIVVYDKAGNSSGSALLTLDKTAPILRIGTASGTALSAGSTYYYSSNQTICFSDATSGYYRALHDYETAPQDGVFYITNSSYTLNMEVKYTITVYDYAGNSAKFYIVIDKTAPTISCGGTTLSSSRVYKNAACQLSFSDTYFNRYTITGAVSTNGTASSYTISTEGAYTITAYDKAGNSKTGYITLDLTAPIMTEGPNGTALTAGGTINYFAGSDIEFYFYDDISGFAKATHDFATAPQDAIYDTTNSSMILSAGYEYRITLYDVVGNKATYYVVLDNTAPTITCGGTNLSSTRVYKNTSCTISFSDDYYSKYTITGAVSVSGTGTSYTIEKEGEYTVIAYDIAGNKKTGYITLDFTAPVMRVSSATGTALTAGSTTYYSSNQTFYFTDALSGYYRAHHDYTTAPQSGVFYITSTSYTLSITGVTYTITVYDNAGNSAKFYIVIDKTAPNISCGGTSLSTTRVYKNTSCKISFSDDNFTNFSITGTVNTNGTATSYTIEKEGAYTIVAYDKAGNSKTGYITLDFTAPVMRVGSSSGTVLTAGSTNYYTTNKTFYFSDALSGYYRTLHDYATAPQDGVFYITDTSYTLNMEVEYTITVYDNAGNSAKFNIIIDKTAPTIKCGGTTLSSSRVYKNAACSLSFSDTYFSRYTITGTVSANGTATSYTISAEGAYTITAYDIAGNSKVGYISIDKTAPVMRVGSSSGRALNVTNSSETIINYFTGESKTFYFSDAISGYYRAHHDFVTAPSDALYYTTDSSIILYSGYTYRITVYDNVGNSAKFMIKLSGSDDNISTDAILASATLSNGKITFNKASSNNIQEIYKNGTVRYFIGKPDVYDSNLSDAFDKYGVTVSASTFFASAWTTPQGLVGQFKLYVELSGTNLTTIFAKSSAINITNSGTSTTSFALELDEPPEEKVVDPVVALSTSNIMIKDTALETNYLLFVSMIVISSLLAIEVIIIRKNKIKKAHK